MPKHEDKIIQENLLMKAQLMIKDGYIGESDGIEPEIENKFLKQCLEFENAQRKPVVKVTSINPEDYPPEKELSDKELEEKYRKLVNQLAMFNIYPAFTSKLPIRLAYKHIFEEFLKEEMEVVPGMSLNLDGCTGWCPDCFQLKYCESAKEIWTEEELEKEKKKSRK